MTCICHDADENMRLLDCHYEKKDWRQCIKEVRDTTSKTQHQINMVLTRQMEQFRKCWKEHGNDKRTSTTDTDRDEHR